MRNIICIVIMAVVTSLGQAADKDLQPLFK
jgi:hypothetical protein